MGAEICLPSFFLSPVGSVREWYRQVRALNKTALPFLIGTKYDVFYGLEKSDQVRLLLSGALRTFWLRFAWVLSSPEPFSTAISALFLFISSMQSEILTQARKFAKAMKAPLIFCSVCA